jgi:hypothetical protein
MCVFKGNVASNIRGGVSFWSRRCVYLHRNVDINFDIQICLTMYIFINTEKYLKIHMSILKMNNIYI